MLQNVIKSMKSKIYFVYYWILQTRDFGTYHIIEKWGLTGAFATLINKV